MAIFKKKKAQASTSISTASLPDIVFMLLFFFMVTTVMREQTLLVNSALPKAAQLQKLERKSLVSYVYIGKPRDEAMGKEARIQLNDALSITDKIVPFVEAERLKLDESERDLMTVSLKVDKETKMGVVIDVRNELREANALKMNYSTTKALVKE